MLNHCLVVINGLGIIAATRSSFVMTRGHAWRIVGCGLCLYVPYVMGHSVMSALYPELYASILKGLAYTPGQRFNPSLFIVSSVGCVLILLATVVVFRLFTLVSGPSSQQTPVAVPR